MNEEALNRLTDAISNIGKKLNETLESDEVHITLDDTSVVENILIHKLMKKGS